MRRLTMCEMSGPPDENPSARGIGSDHSRTCRGPWSCQQPNHASAIPARSHRTGRDLGAALAGGSAPHLPPGNMRMADMRWIEHESRWSMLDGGARQVIQDASDNV